MSRVDVVIDVVVAVGLVFALVGAAVGVYQSRTGATRRWVRAHWPWLVVALAALVAGVLAVGDLARWWA